MQYEDYWRELFRIRDSIAEEKKADFDRRFAAKQKNPVVILGFSFFLGWLGIDRFLLGNVFYGIIKLILGVISQIIGALPMENEGAEGAAALISFVLFIPIIVDYFLVTGRARARNIALAQEEQRLLS